MAKGKGKMDQAKGKMKEAAGKVTGNDSMKAEGRMDQVKGKARETRAEAEDQAREAVRNMPGRKK
ncbi:CsbD family protein [Streptomyces sp. NPDC001691]|uniref:CsbD family protein n=1 Tax=Streptomyces sp. NPDC001691 TaxID=3364600 RepID=UPI0036A59739